MLAEGIMKVSADIKAQAQSQAEAPAETPAPAPAEAPAEAPVGEEKMSSRFQPGAEQRGGGNPIHYSKRSGFFTGTEQQREATSDVELHYIQKPEESLSSTGIRDVPSQIGFSKLVRDKRQTLYKIQKEEELVKGELQRQKERFQSLQEQQIKKIQDVLYQ